MFRVQSAHVQQCLVLSLNKVLGVIRAMDTIDFPSVCFWWGQIAAEKCLYYTNVALRDRRVNLH